MAIEAELHDGRILEFPDDTDPTVVQNTVKRVLGLAPPIATPATVVPDTLALPAVNNGLFTPMGDTTGIAALPTAPVQPKPQSVLQTQPVAPALPTEDPMLRPDFVAGVEARLNALPQAQRQTELDKMLARPDVYGRAAKVIAGRYAARDAVVSPTLKNIDPRLEPQIGRFTKQGASAEVATNLARQQALQGQIRPDLDQMQESPPEVAEAAPYNVRANANGFDATMQTIGRAGKKALIDLEQGYRGINQFALDALNIDQPENQKRIDSLERFSNAMGVNPSVPLRYVENALESIGSQLPGLLGGAAAGEAAVYGQMFAQSFGQTYGQSDNHDLDPVNRTARAAAYGALEVLGEVLGMKETIAGIKASVKGMPTSEIVAHFAKALARDIPGELGTYVGQQGVDKAFGLNEQTIGQFIQGAVDTAIVTVLQGGLMMGGGAAIGKGVRAVKDSGLLPEGREGYQQDKSYEGVAERMARTQGFLVPEAAPGAPPAPAVASFKAPSPADMGLGSLGAVVPKTEAAPPVAPAPAPVQTPERDAKIAALAQRIEMRGTFPEEALRIATAQVDAEEQAAKPAESAPAPKQEAVDPRVAAITDDLVAAGVPPDQAKQQAVQMAQEEKKKDAEAEQGATNAIQPVAPPSGAGVQVAGQPSAGPAAEGVGKIEPSGVVHPAENAGPTLAGEVGKPAPVAPTTPTAPEPAPPQIASSSTPVKTEIAEPAKPAFPPGTPPIEKWPDEALKTVIEARLAEPPSAERDAQIELVKQEIERRASKGEFTSVPTPTQAQQTTQEGQAPAGPKRGRPALYTEAEKALKATQKKAANAAYMRSSRALPKVLAQLNESLAPIDEDKIEDDAQLAEAQEDKRAQKVNAIQQLLAMEEKHRGTPIGKQAKAVLADRTKISEREITDIKAGMARAKALKGEDTSLQSFGTESKVGKPNEAFKNAANAVQAAGVIARTGNWFHKLVANRLKGFLTGVKFVVVEKDDPIPKALDTEDNRKHWERARGVYYTNLATGERTIYVRGSSFGEDQGVNNTTILHELLHAATNRKLELALDAIKTGHSLNAPLTRVYKDLLRTMNSAGQRFNELARAGKLPERVRSLAKDSNVFDDPREFVAYGMSDPDFQNFLEGAHGFEDDTSFFTRFVDAVREFFGMGENTTNALSDLVVITDKLLTTKKSPEMQVVERGEERAAKDAEKISPQKKEEPEDKELKSVRKRVDNALADVKKSMEADKVAGAANTLYKLTDIREFGNTVKDFYAASDNAYKGLILHVVPTDYLVEWANNEGVPELLNTNRLIQEMHGKTAMLLEGAEKVSNVIFKALKKDKSLLTKLPEVIYTATKAEIDPIKDTRDHKLTKLYNALGPEGQKVYKLARDYYADMSVLYHTLLTEQINDLPASSKDRNDILVKIKEVFETGEKIDPYFPLVRRGDFWLRVDKGTERKFYMYQTLAERNSVARDIAKKRNRTVEELKQDGTFSVGNDIKTLREESFASSKMLTEIFKLIENTPLTTTAVPAAPAVVEKTESETLAPDDVKDRLKDAIYQLFLTTLPDQSFRKQFIHREGIIGFSTDFMRNFSDTAVTMSVQLSRIQYAAKILTSLSAAQDSIANREQLQPFVSAMRDRVAIELPKSTHKSFMAPVVNLLTRSTFAYYLSSISSAILQPMSVIQFALPLLGARHGYTQTTAEFAKLFKVWDTFGITRRNADGSINYIMPSLREGNLSPIDRRAMQHMIGRNVGQVTMTSEMLARKGRSSEKSLSTVGAVTRNTLWAVAGGPLMHTAERLAQETVYLMSFRLSRQNAEKEFKDSAKYKAAPESKKLDMLTAFQNEHFQDWVNQAVIDTHESLGNLAPENRPPLMRNEFGKFATQFNMFPLHQTVMTAKNFYRMAAPVPTAHRWESAKIFWGMMASTWVLGGLVAIPMISTIIGWLSGLWKDKKDERPKELQDIDFYTWVRTVWLPEQFGADMAALIERGPLNYATGADFSSRISLDNMYFRDSKEAKDPKASVEQFVMEHFSPSLTMALSYADGYKAFKQGDWQRAIEKWAPASIRGPILSHKYATQGAETPKGEPVMAADSFTLGNLIWQAGGLRPDALSDVQGKVYKFIGLKQGILNERAELWETLVLHDRKAAGKVTGTPWEKQQYEKAYIAIQKFNVQYPDYAIKNIDKSLEGREKARDAAIRGATIEDSDEALLVPMLESVMTRADKREADMRK